MRATAATQLLFLGLAACPQPPVTEDCQRALVDSAGGLTSNDGPGGGPGGGPGAAPPALSVEGALTRLTTFGPLSACASDALRVEVELIDPDFAPLPFELEGPPSLTGQGAVKSTLRFTPRGAGLHTVRVRFEPSLGVRTVLLDVAHDGMKLGPAVRVPVTCPAEALWPLSDDTVACEDSVSGQVELRSADAGVERFPGQQLVVVDRVLWSVNAGRSVLERRVLGDAGVALTHSFGGFAARPTPALQDVDLALRYRTNGILARVRIQGSQGSVRDVASSGSNVGPPLAWFLEDNEVLYRWARAECPQGVCITLADFVGIEPGFVWRAATEAHALARPSPREPFPSAFTVRQARVSTPSPLGGFERWPLWLVNPGAPVLVTVDGKALSLTAWPDGQLLRVGRGHFLRADPETGFVQLVRR